jgi:endonuclease YncB( thermonuclease family)
MIKTTVLLAMFAFLFYSGSFNALVIGVASGDTIVVSLDNGKQLRVRLEGIDCPELNQEFGEEAKKATVALCFKKKVRIEKTGVDAYGRTLAFVYVSDSCINKQLIRMGMAWQYKEFNNDPELAKLETEAREHKVGLWQQPNPQAPWDFRRKSN